MENIKSNKIIEIGKNKLLLLIGLLIIEAILLIYAWMFKRQTSSPIELVMYNREANTESINNISNEQFWNNYPYYVLLSRHKSLDRINLFNLNNDSPTPIQNIPNIKSKIFYRYNYLKADPILDSKFFQYFKKHKYSIIILTDIKSFSHLSKNVMDINNFKIYTFLKNLPIRIDMLNKSYFFKLDSTYSIKDILVPRIENLEIMQRYFSFITSQIN